MSAAQRALELRRDGDLAGAVAAFAVAADEARGDDPRVLAGVLCEWAETLTRLGDPLAGAARASEAVELLRTAAMIGDRAVANPEAARALLVLGTAELHGGDAGTGRLAAAADMARRAATALPTEANRALLATTLNHRSTQAQILGDLAEAVSCAEEAVNVRRELAAGAPSRFELQLASSLNNLGGAQYESGDTLAAAASVTEACDVLRRLFDAGDASALPTLAASESNAAAILGDVPDLDRAVRLGAQAVEHYEQLTAALPAPAFVVELAKARVVLATCVAGDDRFDLAARLSYAATVVLVEHAEHLAPPGVVFIETALRHYMAFVALSGEEADHDLVSAAGRALAGGRLG